MKNLCLKSGLVAAVLSSVCTAQAASPKVEIPAGEKARVVEFWTPERRASAMPRDLVIDPGGQAYLKGRDGQLLPYGHGKAAGTAQQGLTPVPAAKPGGGASGGDTTPPGVTDMAPGAGATIGAAATFSASVTDNSGVLRSVSFKVRKGSARAQSFTASNTGGTTWSVSLQGFSDGAWSWQVVAKDKAGNTTTTPYIGFNVDTSSGGGTGSSGETVANAHWTSGGAVQYAAGRIYFEMPYNSGWGGFVCSGTVATDATDGRSVIMTASHCVYDDANKLFARNVLFIPNQDGTTGGGTDLICGNDPMGCWTPSFGVVDVNWTTRTFPYNIPWDYAYYVVPDSGAHSGATASSETLDVAAGSLPVSFAAVIHDDASSAADYTHALGYSYKDDPKFMYCAEDMSTDASTGDWWLDHCGLTGGASGGAWVQPMDTTSGSGDMISVNSYGYVDNAGNALPGMAGPVLWNTSASCVFAAAKAAATPVQPASGGKGVVATCP